MTEAESLSITKDIYDFLLELRTLEKITPQLIQQKYSDKYKNYEAANSKLIRVAEKGFLNKKKEGYGSLSYSLSLLGQKEIGRAS